MPEATTVQSPQPMQWFVNGLKLAGLGWGNTANRPILALHGWLDNAASFAVLAPLLSGFYVVAVDLTGHGKSARRSADASYQIWDDLPEILGILDALGWSSFDLLGHSRGAIIATLLASTYPERVRHLVLLDAVSPQPVEESAFPIQMRKAMQDKPRLLERANRTFSCLEEAVVARTRNGLSAFAAGLIVERNLCVCEDGMTWTTDPRLHGASPVKLTGAQIRAVLKALNMPTLLMLAEETSTQLAEYAGSVQDSIDNLVVYTIKGGHHFHMGSGVSEVVQHMDSFLSQIHKPESSQ